MRYLTTFYVLGENPPGNRDCGVPGVVVWDRRTALVGAASTLRRGLLGLQGFLRLEEIQGSHPVLTAFNINQQVGYFAREVLLDEPPEGFGGHGLPVFQ